MYSYGISNTIMNIHWESIGFLMAKRTKWNTLFRYALNAEWS